jgi:hypothetical protein
MRMFKFSNRFDQPICTTGVAKNSNKYWAATSRSGVLAFKIRQALRRLIRDNYSASVRAENDSVVSEVVKGRAAT